MTDTLANFRKQLPLARTVEDVEWIGFAMEAQGTLTPEVIAAMALRRAEIMKGARG